MMRGCWIGRWGLLVLRCVLTVGLAGGASGGEAGRLPNVVVILADDQGWGDVSLHGNTDLSTPHIDSLARDGAGFDRFFVCAVCAPTRAEFLTGRYHLRGGVHGVSTGAERLNTDEKTIADAFRGAGYATGCFGKWHNGMQYPYHPRGRGFDWFVGFCSGHWGQYIDPELERDGEYFRAEGYITDFITDEAIGFIEANKDKPFFCYVPLPTPHSPMQVPDSDWERFKDKPLKMGHAQQDDHTRAALAMVENIDDNVGRLLATLDALELDDNTIVIYFSDNGPNGRRWNGGMRGIKGSTDEGGLRVPLLIRWPGHIAGGRKIDSIAAAIDLLPTLVDLAGIERVGDNPLDGRSLKPELLGQRIDRPARAIYSHQSSRVSVRTQQYRLDERGRLYDMLADPGQTTDIAAQNPREAERLRALVEAWKQEVGVGANRDDRPFTVGHADWPITELPARDATFVGQIKRSSRHPNCSYLLNWSSTDDRITWDVEVLEEGRYTAYLDYACPAADVGATIELRFGEAVVSAKITEAHDPPAIGAGDDRSPRPESLVKDWRRMALGEIELAAGRGMLTLLATDVPGGQAAEVRRVTLVRVEAGQ